METEFSQLIAEIDRLKTEVEHAKERICALESVAFSTTSYAMSPDQEDLTGFIRAACAIAGDDAVVVPPQSAFKSAGYLSIAWRDQMVDQLISKGLVNKVKRGVGGGTFLAEGHTLGSIAIEVAGDAKYDRPAPSSR